MAIGSVAPPLRATQAPVLMVGSVIPDFSIAQLPVLVVASGMPCASRWAQVWTITRTDGEVFRFTSLDRDMTWGGSTYRACDSLVPSASESVAEVGSGGTMDLSGAVGEGGLSELALYGGQFDGARVEAWLVPWAGEGSPRRLLAGTFGPVNHGETGFSVELKGDASRLEQTPLVRTLKPGCDYLFGGPGCEKDLAGLVVTGTVDAATSQSVFTDAARVEGAGYFSRGRVTFTTGLNAGVTAEIKEHRAGGVFELWPTLAYPVVVGVEYEMTPGCTHLKDSANGTNGCTAWENLLNYGGNDKVPGGDKRSAAAKTRAA